MDIKTIYEYCKKVGCLSFSTWNGSEVASRIAGFFAFDDSGLYFLTMNVKPFYKQMIEYKTLSVCGMYPKTQVEIDENNLPFFIPGYTIRITGEVRELSLDEVEEKAKSNKDFNVAVHDIKKYPATKILVLYNGSGEVYDYDYGMRKRDHKLIRTAFAFGGAPLKPAGLRINENCTGCGACKEACTFKAIDEGTPYTIRRERCDECGNCYGVCPAGAISLRETN